MPQHDSSQYDEMYTVVENISGAAKTFSSIGKRLDADEVIAIPGDLIASLGSEGGGGSIRDPRDFNAVSRSLARKSLRIRSRPTPIFWDYTLLQPFGLAVQNGILGLVDPTYSSGVSSDFDKIDVN